MRGSVKTVLEAVRQVVDQDVVTIIDSILGQSQELYVRVTHEPITKDNWEDVLESILFFIEGLEIHEGILISFKVDAASSKVLTQ
jgi:homospermidine synthase